MEKDGLIIKRRGEDEYKTFSIRVREDLVIKIEDIASKSDLSRNDVINLLLEYGVSHTEIKWEQHSSLERD